LLLNQSIQPRPKRNTSLQAYLRQLVHDLPSSSSSSSSSSSLESNAYASKAQELLEVGAFLKSQRLHKVRLPLSLLSWIFSQIELTMRAGAGMELKDLLERYNPTHGMSVQERTQATARRVGLDVPDELDMTK
jgi:hypothetical protein